MLKIKELKNKFFGPGEENKENQVISPKVNEAKTKEKKEKIENYLKAKENLEQLKNCVVNSLLKTARKLAEKQAEAELNKPDQSESKKLISEKPIEPSEKSFGIEIKIKKMKVDGKEKEWFVVIIKSIYDLSETNCPNVLEQILPNSPKAYRIHDFPEVDPILNVQTARILFDIDQIHKCMYPNTKENANNSSMNYGGLSSLGPTK